MELCVFRALGVGQGWLAGRLRETAERARLLLEQCPGGDRDYCELLLRELTVLLEAGRVAVALALVIDDGSGETIDALYAVGGGEDWLVLSPHVLFDTGYAVHAILHELAHAIGIEWDEAAEALVLSVSGAADVPEAPRPVVEAAEKLRRRGCVVERSRLRSGGWPLITPEPH